MNGFRLNVRSNTKKQVTEAPVLWKPDDRMAPDCRLYTIVAYINAKETWLAHIMRSHAISFQVIFL